MKMIFHFEKSKQTPKLMFKAIFISTIFLSHYIISFGQTSVERMLFVIDSIPLFNDPEDWNPINSEDIAYLHIVTNKDSLGHLGWAKMDGVTYVFTNRYINRPDSLKKIPSLKQMTLKDENWCLNKVPYSGRYIDYYNSGRIQNEGYLDNGKLNGALTVYFKSGMVKSVSDYKNGLLNGFMNQYYKNGQLMQKSGYTNGIANNVDENYFINGQNEIETKVKKETGYDTVIHYYSSGKINNIRLIKHGQSLRGKNENDRNYYATMFQQHLNLGNMKEAKKLFGKLWQLDSSSIDTRFKKGMLLNVEQHFDEAIVIYDAILQDEPLDRNVLVERGLARMKKHQLIRPETSQEKRTPGSLGLEDISSMTDDEQKRVCNDLLLADDLDPSDYFIKKAVPEAVLNYCRSKSNQ